MRTEFRYTDFLEEDNTEDQAGEWMVLLKLNSQEQVVRM